MFAHVRRISIPLAMLAATTANAGSAYDEFSAASNPSGAWSYGWKTTLAGSFNLFSNKLSANNHDYWYGPQAPLGGLPGYPEIDRSTIDASGILLAHPGSGGEYAILRWIAPTTSAYNISTQFSRQDTAPTTTDVYVILGGVTLFSGALNASSASQSFSQSIALNAGSVLDFAVGYGSNGNYFFDRTGIGAAVSVVPELPAHVLLACGLFYLRRQMLRRADA